MRPPDKNIPPRWADRLLQWYCKAELFEDLQGDLYEYFYRNVKSKGVTRARLIYIIDVFKFCRIYTLRKPEFLNLLIHWIMLGSYIKTSGRNLVRNKLFSAINIFGLALSMSVGLLLIVMLSDALTYDRFHAKYDRLYRLTSLYQFNGNTDADVNATTSLKSGRLLKDNVSGIEDVAVLFGGFGGDLQTDDRTIALGGFWADEGLFKVFSFELLEGNASTALREPFSLVLTQSGAKKVFGAGSAVNKTVKIGDRLYTITGVVKDPPKFSHLNFEVLASLSSRDVTESHRKSHLSWDNVWRAYVYFTTSKDADLELIKRNLDDLSAREDKTVANTHIELGVQPLGDIVIGEHLSNQAGPTLGSITVWILSTLTLIVILCACFNYTNLSVARAFRRSREVGIRKTIGAQQRHVIFQFITEAVMISLIALVFAIGLFLIIRPHFISLEESLQNLLVLELSPSILILFILFAIGVGVVAGFFPAFFFSRINTIKVLKNLTASPTIKGMTTRKVLIVVQYSISIIAITTTVIMSKQYKHFINYDLGFETENILNIDLQGNKAPVVMKALSEIPEVTAMSSSVMVTSVGNYYGMLARNPLDKNDSAFVQYNGVDEHYLPLHGHQLIAGRNFIFQPDSAANQVIVNEQFLRRFALAKKEPSEAIGQVVNIDHKNLQIVGVVKDFEYGRANNESRKEVVIRYEPGGVEHVNLKIASTDILTTLQKIEAAWKVIDNVHPLNARFYEDQIEESFKGMKASVKVAGFLASLVIVIASIGLLGMVVFTTETKLKEISIRKVHGASTRRLMMLLSRNFVWLLVIATVIALPLTYFIFEQLLLPELANHAPIGMEIFAGVTAILFLALLMIVSQTLRAAQTNPADILKAE